MFVCSTIQNLVCKNKINKTVEAGKKKIRFFFSKIQMKILCKQQFAKNQKKKKKRRLTIQKII